MFITTYQDNSHQNKLANQGTLGMWVGLQKVIQSGHTMCTTPRLKQYFNQGCDFPTESYGDWSKVDDEVVATTENNQTNHNNYNVVSNSESNDEENIFDEDVDNEVESHLQTTVNAYVICAMKKLQALYNSNANKIV